jgi:1-acyl-sn-glycerol-3-phosphate acyltransferase
MWFRTLIQKLFFLWAAMWLAILIITAFPLAVLLLFFPMKIKDSAMFWILKGVCYAFFYGIGSFPKWYNKRNIDFKRSYIVTPNHQSYADAGIIYMAIPTLFKTLGKSDLLKVPIYGLIYKMVVISIDRSSTAAKAAGFRRMQKELSRGLNIVIFPEGTFSNEPKEELLPFQLGGFALAVSQKKDILPILFLDAASILHPSDVTKICPHPCRIVFLPPIQAELYGTMQVKELKQYASNYMQFCLNHCRNSSPASVWEEALQWQVNNSKSLT